MSARLGYDVTGDPDAPVVVLGSSLGTTRAMWDPQLTALAQRFRVIRFDHRGHGESELPPAPYRIGELGRDVLDLLDSLGVEHFAYAGLSLGGMVGMWIGSEAPDRVRQLCLLCTSAALESPDAWHERAATVRAGGLAAITDRVTGRWFTPGFAAERPDVVTSYRRMLGATAVEGYAGCCEAIAVMDLRDRLAAITAPTLAIAAADDLAIPPAHLASIVASVAGARLCLVEPAAHLANVERPERITTLLLEHFEGD